jgi:hypothetical protein
MITERQFLIPAPLRNLLIERCYPAKSRIRQRHAGKQKSFCFFFFRKRRVLFFSEEKNQKTFASWRRFADPGFGRKIMVFQQVES